MKDFLFKNNIETLPVTFEHIQALIKLPAYHNDPFDRLIISQSITEDLVILTKDSKFSLYAADINWD